MQAQVDEAWATPWSFFSLSSRFGVVPNTPKTAMVDQTPTLSAGVGPFLQIGVNGTVPLYTFGKISSAGRAAEAQARYGEWDLEKAKWQIRTDVRRAFFGLAFTRDSLHLADDTLVKLNDALASVVTKIESGDDSIDDADRIRLEMSRDEILARIEDAKRGEAADLAVLRFYTGVQSGFDVPDEPLGTPERPLGPVVEYIAGARLRAPDVNRARAGAVARAAQVSLARANGLPNFGLGMRFDYAVAPGVDLPVSSGFDASAANHLQYGAAFGVEWQLDFLTKNARLRQAKANLEEARAMERLALGGVATEVEAAYAAALEANRREERWASAVRRAKGWIVAVENAIDLGTKDERALLEPLRTFVNARISQLQALMDSNLTRAELARVSGLDDAS